MCMNINSIVADLPVTRYLLPRLFAGMVVFRVALDRVDSTHQVCMVGGVAQGSILLSLIHI